MAGDYPILESAQIVWPTKQQMEEGLAAIERHEPVWRASPALLVIKPRLGLIVSLKQVEHDERYFALAIAVQEAIVAPDGFDPQIPLTLRCVWNQPYMSLGANQIGAPYSFYLDWSPFLRQTVKTHFSLNGELSHGIVTQAVHAGV